MKIEDYQEPEDGDISFVVDSEKYQRVLEHLRTKGLTVGGHHSDTSFSEIVVSATIDELNDALKDFEE